MILNMEFAATLAPAPDAVNKTPGGQGFEKAGIFRGIARIVDLKARPRYFRPKGHATSAFAKPNMEKPR